MLQEILLSLSGVPSPIWQEVKESKDDVGSIQGCLSEPERAMIAKLTHISRLHIEVKNSTSAISSKHPSAACRAVSSSIDNTHLAAFRKRVVEVEASILRGDTSHVGGYQIVPLSTLVADFAPWIRRLEWLQRVTQFMKATKSKKSLPGCTSAALLDFLDDETHTGFTDVGEFATHLLTIAQGTWMRSISTWILYGLLPSFSREDFMIQESSDKSEIEQCHLEQTLVPKVVSAETAESILAIGNAIRQIQSPSADTQSEQYQSTVTSLMAPHLAKIRLLEYPLNSSSLKTTMSFINESISKHALANILPRSKVIEICQVIQKYVLLGRGEFAVTLIENADARVAIRQKSQSSSQPIRKLGRVDDMEVKDAELNSIISKTWSDLAALQSQAETEHDTFEIAKRTLSLQAVGESESSMALAPLMTLLPSPTALLMNVSSSSPLRLFLSLSTTQCYSRINGYLLSIRRAHLRLTSLWKLTSHRRCHPTPLGPPMSATEFGQRACRLRRNRESVRAMNMRRFWSSMNKSLFFLNEFGFYLHGEVIGNSWKQFEMWLDTTRKDDDLGRSGQLKTPTQGEQQTTPAQKTATNLGSSDRVSSVKDDPRTLARAHVAYLDALNTALLVDRHEFVSTLKAFLNMLDHFVGLFTRLSTVWQGLDLQEDDGVMDAFTNFTQDEKDVIAEMDRGRNAWEDLLQQLVKHLKDIEKAQDSNHLNAALASVHVRQGASDDFVPWRARTLDRLIMKLDFSYGKEESTDDLVDELEHE